MHILRFPLVRVLCLILVATLAAVLADDAQARKQIYDIIEKPVVTGSGEAISAADMGRILRSAAESKGWLVYEDGPGRLRAEIDVRKHFAAIDMAFTADSWSIRYRDSRVLDYKDGKIHRNYNKWIKHIEQIVDRTLAEET